MSISLRKTIKLIINCVVETLLTWLKVIFWYFICWWDKILWGVFLMWRFWRLLFVINLLSLINWGLRSLCHINKATCLSIVIHLDVRRINDLELYIRISALGGNSLLFPAFNVNYIITCWWNSILSLLFRFRSIINMLFTMIWLIKLLSNKAKTKLSFRCKIGVLCRLWIWCLSLAQYKFNFLSLLIS
jgi:hypothetical protein